MGEEGCGGSTCTEMWCVCSLMRKSLALWLWAVSPSPFGSSNPEIKTEVLLAPHMKSLCVFSPLAPLRVRHSHSIWLWSVEADSGIVRKRVCLKPRWIVLIAWALRLWDQKCDWEIMKDSGGILVGFSHSSPYLYLKRIIICMGSSLDWDLTCLSMFVQHLPQRGLAACLGIFGILALYFADAQGRIYSCNRKRGILPSTPSPVRDSLWGFSHSLQACEADFIPSRGIWTPQCWDFSLFFVWVSIPHMRAWVEPLADSVSVGCWPCQNSDHSQILVQGSELLTPQVACLY